ncbi:MAG: C4-dicarboxylic acid transporter DauA [Archangium sp.]|nr:C4-dicarboxylic acid transporter DauA [Archangium sp.]
MGRTRLTDSTAHVPLTSLPAAALRAVLREGYGWRELRRDVVSGFLVGVIALPLAMALAIAVGAPPQQGLYTAIVAGFLTALLGGSRIQVVGPTAAFIVVLAPLSARFGLGGLFVAGMIAGLMLIGVALLRLGRLIEFIPFPVTTGFTAGIACVIAVLQLKDLLGLELTSNPEHFSDRIVAMWEARASANPAELAIGAVTLLLLLVPRLPKAPSWLAKVPAPLIALPVAAVLAAALHGVGGGHVDTIGSRFHSMLDGVLVDGIPRVPPHFLLPWSAPAANGEPIGFDLQTIRALLPTAFTIAVLAAIESLLSAVVADGMARTRHDPDAELLALGIANVVTPFFGGIPATGAIARTASNFRFGGRSPVASMAHALTVLLAIVLLAPAVQYLPMASLAALLLLVAWNMSEAEHFLHTVRVAPRSDVAVLLTCFVLTVVFDMVIAVTAGVLLASMLFMRRMAVTTEGKFVESGLPVALPEGVTLYDINGPLFFGAAERAMGAIRAIGDHVKVVIFRLEEVDHVDVTGLVALESVLEELAHHGIKAVLVGAPPAALEMFAKAGLKPVEGKLAICRTLDEALGLLGARVHHYRRTRTGPVRVHVMDRHKRAAAHSPRPVD